MLHTNLLRAISGFIGCASGMSYDNLKQAGRTANPGCLDITSDGLHLLELDGVNNILKSGTMATAGDITTYAGTGQLNVTAIDNDVTDAVWGDSGTKIYMLGRGGDKIYQLDLSTAYDADTITDSGNSIDISPYDSVNSRDLDVSADGTKIYMHSAVNYTVYEFNMSTAWDLSSDATPFHQSFTYNDSNLGYSHMRFNDAGTILYFLDDADAKVKQYPLSIAYDITTMVLDSDCEYTYSEDTNMEGLALAEEVNKMYLAGNTSTEYTYQYSIP